MHTGDWLMEVYQVVIKSSSGQSGYKISSGKIYVQTGGSFERIYAHGRDQEKYIYGRNETFLFCCRPMLYLTTLILSASMWI